MADELAGRLAMVAAALRLGELSYWQATAIVDATSQLSDDQAGWVARRVLPRARKQTLAQLRASLRRAVLAVAPHTARQATSSAPKPSRASTGGPPPTAKPNSASPLMLLM